MLSRVLSSPAVRVALGLVALGFLGYGVARNWADTTAALARLSPWSVAGALAAVLAGQFCMLLAWREILAGLGTRLPLAVAGRILFLGQLGKYVPGSVWAYAAMMELGRHHGSPPRRTFACISLGLVISLGVALSIAAATAREAFAEAWYVLLLIPVIAVCLHPRVLTWGLNLALRLARREPLETVLPGRSLLLAVGWTALGWLVYGVHIVLLAGTGYPVSTGAYAFAWVAGLLTFVIPAGVGVREGALAVVLGPLVGPGLALVTGIVSRLVFTLSELIAAGGFFLLARRPKRVEVDAPEGVGVHSLDS
ncbi:lysylphosphatidylglycerol synthase domain-containing protein [Thermoactinospora rubra]|uniref:lysylphosphatidylglycerol synthase domain-containing protein n=1 Tax=Thermoactinospora rubra TaxID=1088767 RepID=UPI000A11C6F8|nr:lysylphosphatidylglycerol synthase domain-containing protein [Thermoactinospora rubra]